MADVGRWLRFGVVGVTATAVHMGVAVATVEAGGAHPQVANMLGFAVAFVVSYLGQRYFTFGSDQAHSVALVRFAVVAGTGALVNLLVSGALLKLGLYYAVAIFIGLSVAAVVNYQLNRQWAFARRTS